MATKPRHIHGPLFPRPGESDTERDRCGILVGFWVKSNDGTWNFEPDGSEKRYIQLFDGMLMCELGGAVAEALGLWNTDPQFKFTYKAPEWLELAEGQQAPPQLIIDDADVVMFITLRRIVDELDLLVTYSKRFDPTTCTLLTLDPRSSLTHPPTRKDSRSSTKLPTVQPDRSSTDIAVPGPSTSNKPANQAAADVDEAVDSDTDSDWHDFAYTSPEPPPVARSLISEFDHVGGFLTPPPTIFPFSSSVDAQIEGVGAATTVLGSSRRSRAAVIETGTTSKINPLPNSSQAVRTSRVAVMETGTSSSSSIVRSMSISADPFSADDADMSDVGDHNLSVWESAESPLSTFVNDRPENAAMFLRDAPPVFNGLASNGVDSALFDLTYEGDLLFVGRVFKSKEDCKIKIAIHAINRKFHFKTHRSAPKFMVLRCVSESCGWRVYCAAVGKSPQFQVRQASLTHSCDIDARRQYHRLATTHVIAELIATRYVGIKKGPSPAGIRKILLDEFSINISYWKAWSAREAAMDRALGSVAGSYALVPEYLKLIETANPGSLTFVDFSQLPEGKQKFNYCFLAFSASIQGFQWMRKVIVVDGTSLKARYGGVLVSACCQDANFQIFPLAYGIVDSENDASWEWFFSKLNSFVPDTSDLVFISDRHASIYSGLRKVYNSAHHGACTVHLYRNIQAQFKPKHLADIMSRAARCFTVIEFNKIFSEIQLLNPECATYLHKIGFEHWTRCHFRGDRYNVMDSNIAESWNNVIKEAREYPIVCMFEFIRIQVMSWFAIRRAKAARETGIIPPEIRARLEAAFDVSGNLSVRPISGSEFEIQDRHGASNIVKMDYAECSCREYQLIGLPCPHAFAAAAHLGIPTATMIRDPFILEYWRNSYVGKIYPIPAVGGVPLGGIEVPKDNKTVPPKPRRPPGRPRKLRIRSRGEFKRDGTPRKRRCSRCFSTGHNRASCRHAM